MSYLYMYYNAICISIVIIIYYNTINCNAYFIIIYIYIYIYIYKLPIWLGWLRRQTYKEYDSDSSLVQTINIGITIMSKSDLIYVYTMYSVHCVYL